MQAISLMKYVNSLHHVSAIHLQSEYEAIEKKCRLFAVELLDLCRRTTEVEILLARADGVTKVNTAGGKTQYPRALISVEYNQKEVSGSENCSNIYAINELSDCFLSFE